MSRSRRRTSNIRNFFVLRMVTGWIVCSLLSCRGGRPSDSGSSTPPPKQSSIIGNETTDRQTIDFCSGCHATPLPSSFPADAWYDEVKRGFDFYHQSTRRDLKPPATQTVVEYFRSRAPASLQVIPSPSVPGPAGVRFRATEFTLPRQKGSAAKPVAASFVAKWPRSDLAGSDLVVSDMSNGGVFLARGESIPTVTKCLAEMNNPAVVSRCDLNGNGRIDVVVAELGSFNPADHDRGRVVWFADVEDQASTTSGVPLAEGLGRVADVQPADIDGDGDTDLIVAEFGWHKTGRTLFLRNDGDIKSPSFTVNIVDRRPGTIHVPIIDFDRDGRLDFVALISQEFEVIEVFLNRGDGAFETKLIHAAGDPAYGSSGIQITDLDGDGDNDVLYTNGDMFDSFLIKPYHGIHWLENTGSFPFVSHRLSYFPGAYRAVAGDLDRDGDLDIVAGALLPTKARESAFGKNLDSLIWLEQLRPREYVRHAIEVGQCIHATLDLADLDGDGDLDIATGMFRDGGSPNQSAVTIWWNEVQAP